MRRVSLLAIAAAGLLGLAVRINPAIGIPVITPPATPPPVETVTGDIVALDAQLSNTHLLQGGDGSVLLELTVTGQERQPATAPQRLPMNLAIVLDRSGSMASQNKLAHAKRAAEFLVDQLLPTDRVALVAYDHHVRLVLASQRVGDGTEVKHAIRALEPGGNTNLHGGMVAGAEQVQRHLATQQVNRVILISDGLANVGVTETPALGRIAQAWGNQGVAITAMGVGLDFNEDLMLGLAEYSGGNYYYVDTPAKLAGIFERELTQLVATVAQDARIQVTLADGVQCVDVAGYTYQQAGRTVTIPLGDLPAGATRRIMLSLRVPTTAAGPHDVAQCRIAFADARDGRRRELASAMLRIERTENDAVVEENRNSPVLEQHERVNAAKVVQRAVGLFEAGRRDEATQILSAESEALRARNAADYKSEDLDAQAAQMKEFADEIAAAPAPESSMGKDVRKRAKAQAYQYQK